MVDLRKKLSRLKTQDLEIVFKLAELRLEETIDTFKIQRARLTEIIKFSIPVIGALLFQINSVSEKCNCYSNFLIGLVFAIIITLVILIWAIILYIPRGICVKGKRPSKLLSNQKIDSKFYIPIIIQYDKSIGLNSDINERCNKQLTMLTIVIAISGSCAVLLYSFALII